MPSALSPRVTFHTAPSPRAIPWSPGEESRIKDFVLRSLDGFSGSWEVTLIFSGVLSHTWVVECQHVEDGQGVRMLVDCRRDEDRAALRAALASLGPRPRHQEEEPWPPACPA
jgi:hypothetical protein